MSLFHETKSGAKMVPWQKMPRRERHL